MDVFLGGVGLLASLPPVAEAETWNRLEIAKLRPTASHSGQVGELAFALEQDLTGACKTLRSLVSSMVEEDLRSGLHGDVFHGERAAEGFLVFANDASAKVDEGFGDVDFDGTDFVARAAKCGRVGQ